MAATANEHRLLGICGALRKGSTNRLLLAEAMRLYAPAAWSEADLRLPLFDEDIETGPGIPAEVRALAGAIAAADAVVIATPEYNKALPGVLKNALDWVSRTKPNPWEGKPVAVVSAAAGKAGGPRGQFSLRLCMVPLGARVLTGPEVMIGDSRHAFDADGRLKDETSLKLLGKLMEALAAEVARG